MTYDDLDIKISITLGQKAAAALNSKNQLLIIQEQGQNGHAVINLGSLTQQRAKELSGYLQQISIHTPEK